MAPESAGLRIRNDIRKGLEHESGDKENDGK